MTDQAGKVLAYSRASGDNEFSKSHTTIKRFGVGVVLKDANGLWWQRKGWFCGSNGDVVILQALLVLAEEYAPAPLEAKVSKGFLDYLKPGGHLDSAIKRDGKNSKGKPFEALSEWKRWRNLTDDKKVLALPIADRLTEITDAGKLASTAKASIPPAFLPDDGAFAWDGDPKPYGHNRVSLEGT